jgi:hypothetical protein
MIVKALIFYKGEIERSRAVKEEITLAKLASRNLYLDEDEFCCYKTLFKKIDR